MELGPFPGLTAVFCISRLECKLLLGGGSCFDGLPSRSMETREGPEGRHHSSTAHSLKDSVGCPSKFFTSATVPMKAF